MIEQRSRTAHDDQLGVEWSARSDARPALAAALVAILLILTGGSASAAVHHVDSGNTFGPGTLGCCNPFEEVTVDESRGFVYLARSNSGELYRYTTSGEPADFTASAPYLEGNKLSDMGTQYRYSGIAVDANTGRIYGGRGSALVVHEPNGERGEFSATGSDELGDWGPGGVSGIAVDANGDIYAAGVETVSIYTPDGALVNTFHGPYGGGFQPIAVDSQGNLYLVHNVTGPNYIVEKYAPSSFPVTSATTYAFAGAIYSNPNGVWSTATDPETNDVYIGTSNGSATGVIHFDEDGNLIETIPALGAFGRIVGVGVDADPDGSTIFVGTFEGASIFDPVPFPDALTGGAEEVLETTATINGAVNPHGLPATYQFEYGTDTSYGHKAPAVPADAGSGSAKVPLSASLSGLLPDTLYHYRLDSTNENGTSYGSDATFHTYGPPTVSDPSVRDVGSTSARLLATVNPHHAPTSYRFEYGTSAAYGASLPLPDAEAGSDSLDHAVSVVLSGLKPGTRYHWRLVASNVAAPPEGVFLEDHTFTTFAAPLQGGGEQLPDGRAWEQVTPADKNGSDIGNFAQAEHALPGLFDPGVHVTGVAVQSSADGNGIEFLSNVAAFGEPQAFGVLDTSYLVKRGPEGWSTESIAPPFVPTGGKEALFIPRFVVFSRDLSRALFFQPSNQAPLTADALPGATGLYLRDAATGSYRFLASPGGELVPNYEGATPDFSHILFSRSSGGEPELFEAYLDQAGEAHERFVSRLPDGTPVPAHAGAGDEEHTLHERDISADGSRIVFATIGAGGPRPEIYLREDGATTRHVSAYAPGVPLDAKAGPSQVFQGANQQVTKVLFTSQTRLTADSTAAHSSGNGYSTGSLGDLYRYDSAANGGAGELSDLTPDVIDAEGAQVLGVLASSDDTSRVYFVARSDQLGSGGVPGQANLYLWDENGGNPTTTFIATLRSPQGPDEPGDSADWTKDAHERPSDITPDGSRLIFTSRNQLTEFDNAGRTEVYVYDAGQDSLECASCAGDQPPAGDSFTPFTQIFTSHSAASRANALSDDGRYVFFTSAASLVRGDTNGRFDAYQYDTQAHRISLLSSGRSSSDSFFQAADPSGQNAFFITRSQLVPADIDDNLDIYDARIGGGIAAQNEVPTTPACEGDSCQPPVIAPNDPTPASSSFQGAGNLAEPRRAKPPACHRPKVRHGRRCLAPHHKRRRGSSRRHG